MKKKSKNKRTRDFWEIAHSWMVASGIVLSRDYCRNEISTHRDYPSLISLTDFLDFGGITYKGVQADASYINEFTYPLLAHIRYTGNEHMFMISDISEWEKHKDVTAHWTGVVLYLENSVDWKNEQHVIYTQIEFRKKRLAFLFLFTGVVLFVLSVFRLQDVNPDNTLACIAFGFLSLCGLILSLISLGAELGFKNAIVRQVCGVGEEGSCEKVLKSSYSRGFLGITPADASVIYFCTQFSVYILSSWYPKLAQGIYLFSFSGMAVACWSMYLQMVKIGHWCALCLSILLMLLLQAAIAVLNLRLVKGIWPEILFACLFILLSMIFVPIKDLIKTSLGSKIQLAEFKKWKQDIELFTFLWRREEEIDTSIWQNDLLIGDSSAPILITVACNPYCGPCARSHMQLDKLLDRFHGKIKVQIRFLFDFLNREDGRTLAVKAILQTSNASLIKSSLKQMMTDWFDWMDYDKWVKKWKPDKHIDVDQQMKLHDRWVAQSHIDYTPTLFINGKKIPARYSLDDVELFIPQLVQQELV